jgi:hypothetical protein
VADLYVALLHDTVYDKNRQTVTTSITTLDIPDIARSCRTYGVRGFYVVTPVDAMRGLARRIIAHWCEGSGSLYNPNRAEALELVRLERTLEGVEIDIEAESGALPILTATSAREHPGSLGYEALREEFEGSQQPQLLLFGTGWGLAAEIIERAHRILEPVNGPGGYNHLSVRAAAAIILDRLCGNR